MPKTNYELHGFYQVVLFGAGLRYWVNGKQHPFEYYNHEKDKLKNFFLGLTSMLAILITIIAIFYLAETA